MAFRLLWGWDALTGLVLLYFFLVGLADGSVSSFNMGLWLGLLSVVAAVLGGSWALRADGRPRLALALLAVAALPGLVYALFLVLILVTNPRWN